MKWCTRKVRCTTHDAALSLPWAYTLPPTSEVAMQHAHTRLRRTRQQLRRPAELMDQQS